MKRTLSSIAAAALVMGTLAPAAFASTSASTYSDITAQYQFAAQDITSLSNSGYIHGYSDGTFRPQNSVTRGQLLAYFWNVVQQGAGPQADAQVYADIAPGNWDFNYVGAAFSKGWLNQYWLGVRPGYNFNENYHASYSDAASYFVAAMMKSGMITSTNGMAPLAFAKAAGLFQGIPASEMTANPVYMDRASTAVFLSNVMAFMNGQLLPAGATVTVVPASANTAPGTTDQLSVVVKLADGSTYTLPSTASVTYSVDNKAGFISPANQLVVTAAGTYNVVATVDGVQSQPVAISVYGAASAVKLSAATSTLVANGQSTDTITATVVDANGNPVSSFNGTVNVADTSSWLAGAVGNVAGLTAVAVTNGVATFNVNAPISPGLSDSITVSGVTPTGGTALANVSASTTVTSVAQVATAVTATPSATVVQDNQATQDNVAVQVVDQAGKPMLWGSFPVTVTVTGNALINGGKSYSTAYIGNGSVVTPTSISVPVMSIQGQGGSIAVNAASGTLTQGNATISSVTVGAPAAVSVKLSGASSSFVAGSTGTTFNVTTVDSSGNPVGAGSYTTAITVASTGVAATGVSASIVGGVMTVTGTAAGTYNVAVSSGTLASATVQVTITAAAANKVAITSPANTVSVSQGSPSVAITAQVEDANGNPVATAGVPVTFTAQQLSTVAGAVYSFNGVSNAPYTVLSNASGQATVTFASQSTPNLSWSIGVSQVNNAPASVTPVTVNTVGLPASSLTVSTTVNNQSTSYATSGNTVTYSVYEKDAYGNNSPNGDTVDVTIPAGMTVTATSGLLGSSTTGYYVQMSTNAANMGSATFTLQAGLAGAQTVSFKDITNANASLTASETVSVTAAAQSTAMFFDGSGLISSSNLLAVTAGVPTAVTLEPTDAAGNLALSSNTLYYNLTDTNGGQYRLTPNGQTVTGVSFAPGQTSVTLYYVNPVGGSYSGMGVVPSTAPAAVAGAAGMTVANSVYTLNFSEPISIGTLSLSGISAANGSTTESFGTGATLSAVNPSNGYASSFTLTPGTGWNVVTSSTITVAQGSVVNQAGQSATGPVTFTTP